MADPKTTIKDAESLLDIHKQLKQLFEDENYSMQEQLASVKAVNSLETKIQRLTGQRAADLSRSETLQKRITANMRQVQTLLADRSGVDRHAEIAKIVKSIRRDAVEKSKIEKEAQQTQLAINKLGLSKAVELTKEMQRLWAENKMLVVAMAGLAVWKKIFSVFKDMDDAAAKFRMEMGATRTYTSVIDANARSIAFEFAQMGINAAMVYESIVAMGRELGSTAFVTKDMAENVSLMQAQFGVAQKTSAEFLKSMGMASQQTANARTHMLLFAQGLSGAAGTPLADVMNDVNTATKSSYSYITRSSIGLIKAAVEAKRMGTSIESTVSTSKSLLAFTKSVTSEMEASVLLGESINLQRARELAYRRDLSGLNKEILKIMKETNFENLDPFQQEAVAAALGKSASELSSMAQAERQRLDLERDMSKETQTQLAAYKKMTQENESNAKALANNAKEQLKIKSNQAAIASITASWNAILQRVGEVFLPAIAKTLGWVATGLSYINSLFEKKYGWVLKLVLAISALGAGIVGVGVAALALMKVFGMLGKLGGGGAGGGIGGVFQGLANGVKAMGSGAVLKGALNIFILAAALVPLALALKLMEGVSWKTVGIMVVALAAVVGAVILLGAGPVAAMAAIGTAILIGIAAAMVIFAAAAWIGAKAMKNLSDVRWMEVAKGIFAVGIQAPMILGMGLAMAVAAPGILAFSLALIPLSIMAKRAGDSMMNMGTGFKLIVDSIERLQNLSLINTILQVRSLAVAVTELSQALKTMPDIQVEKIERLQMRGAAAGETPAAGAKDTSVVDEIRGMRDELKKLREDFASGTLRATVNIDSQKVDAATGRSLEFKGVLV